jgi:hypothetical protein
MSTAITTPQLSISLGNAGLYIIFKALMSLRPSYEVRTSENSGLEARTSNSVEESYDDSVVQKWRRHLYWEEYT